MTSPYPSLRGRLCVATATARAEDLGVSLAQPPLFKDGKLKPRGAGTGLRSARQPGFLLGGRAWDLAGGGRRVDVGRPGGLPYVAESIIVQQNDKLVGLVYPDFDEAFAHGLKNEDMERVMEENRITLNEMLPAYSQISKMKIYPEEFEKTPKKSIKRFLYQEAKG